MENPERTGRRKGAAVAAPFGKIFPVFIQREKVRRNACFQRKQTLETFSGGVWKPASFLWDVPPREKHARYFPHTPG